MENAPMHESLFWVLAYLSFCAFQLALMVSFSVSDGHNLLTLQKLYPTIISLPFGGVGSWLMIWQLKCAFMHALGGITYPPSKILYILREGETWYSKATVWFCVECILVSTWLFLMSPDVLIALAVIDTLGFLAALAQYICTWNPEKGPGTAQRSNIFFELSFEYFATKVLASFNLAHILCTVITIWSMVVKYQFGLHVDEILGTCIGVGIMTLASMMLSAQYSDIFFGGWMGITLILLGARGSLIMCVCGSFLCFNSLVGITHHWINRPKEPARNDNMTPTEA